jgi:hypothetical protein
VPSLFVKQRQLHTVRLYLFQVGSFFMINLCLVVIATQFSETKKRETERMWLERRRCASSGTLASVEQLGSCYDEIIRYLGHLGRVFRRQLSRLWRLYGCYRRRRRRRRRRRGSRHGQTSADFEVLQCVAADEGGGGGGGHGKPRGVEPRRTTLRFAEPDPPASDVQLKTVDAEEDGSSCPMETYRVNGLNEKKPDDPKVFQSYEAERGTNGVAGSSKQRGISVGIRPSSPVRRKDSSAATATEEKDSETNWFRVAPLCPSCPGNRNLPVDCQIKKTIECLRQFAETSDVCKKLYGFYSCLFLACSRFWQLRKLSRRKFST